MLKSKWLNSRRIEVGNEFCYYWFLFLYIIIFIIYIIKSLKSRKKYLYSLEYILLIKILYISQLNIKRITCMIFSKFFKVTLIKNLFMNNNNVIS